MPEAFVLETLRTGPPDDPDLSPGQLEDLLARSHAGEPKEFRVSVDAFHDLMDGEAQ